MKNFLMWLWIISLNINVVVAGNWVKNFGDKTGDVKVTSVVSDSEGNPIIAGRFSSEQLVLDESNILQNRGISDLFLVKYSPMGEITWAFSFGGDNEEYLNDITIDHEDNIYITGTFKSNPFKIGNSTIISVWPNNVYVAKFDKSGDFQWLKHSTKLTDVYNTISTAVSCDSAGSIYFTGYTRSEEISFGNITLSTDNPNYKGYYGRLDKEGNFEMANYLEGEGDTWYQLRDITTDNSNNIYLAGTKTVHSEPDPITFRDYRDNMYFCKVDPSGEILWAKEDTAFHQADKIIYHNDSIYILGNREEWRIIFNGGTIDTTSSFYFGLYDNNANKIWGKKVTGALAYDAYAGSNSMVVIGGVLLDHLYLGSHQIHRNKDSSAICPIYQDIFYLESDKSGQIVRAESISGSLEDIATGIWLSNNGDLLYTGIYESYKLSVEENDIFNASELSVFTHVSGTYYNRRHYSFLARKAGFSGPSGINPDEDDGFLIYPNPSSGVLHINIKDHTGGIPIKVHDMYGRLVYEMIADGNSILINLSDHQPGMYMVSYYNKKKIVNMPVLILR